MITEMLVASGISNENTHFVEIITLVCTVCQCPTFYYRLIPWSCRFSFQTSRIRATMRNT